MADENPPTNPPPITDPPPGPPTPPAPPAPAPPTDGTPGWLQGLIDAVGAIPEKVAAAVKEQTPAPAPAPRKTGEEHRAEGAKILEDAGKGNPPSKGTESRKRTFADRWFGT